MTGDCYGTFNTNLKSYFVSQDSFVGDFGTAPVISILEDEGSERFYVMALADFETDDYQSFYFYCNAGEDGLAYSYTTFYGDWSAGRGEWFSSRWVSAWNNSSYGNQNIKDLWGYVQDLIDAGWFVPTPGDWCYFLDAFSVGEELGYDELGLSDAYWSSAVDTSDIGYVIGPYLKYNCMDNLAPYQLFSVRLGYCF